MLAAAVRWRRRNFCHVDFALWPIVPLRRVLDQLDTLASGAIHSCRQAHSHRLNLLLTIVALEEQASVVDASIGDVELEVTRNREVVSPVASPFLVSRRGKEPFLYLCMDLGSNCLALTSHIQQNLQVRPWEVH